MPWQGGLSPDKLPRLGRISTLKLFSQICRQRQDQCMGVEGGSEEKQEWGLLGPVILPTEYGFVFRSHNNSGR